MSVLHLSVFLFIALGCTEAADKPSTIKAPKSGANADAGEDSADKPQNPNKEETDIKTKPVDSGKVDDKVVAKPAPVVVPEPVDPSLKLSIPLTEASLSLGPKAPTCKDLKPAKGKSLGVYVNFEVVESMTKISFAANTLCGDLTKKNQLTVYSAAGRTVVKSVELPAQAFTSKKILLEGLTLEEGRYTLAIEVAGTRLSELASILVEGGELTADKKVKFESISDY